MVTHAASRVMKRPQEASQTDLARSSASDIAFARAVVAAMRATPGVADLSSGLMVLAATYGAHERVVGVVVRRSSPHSATVEVHVVLEVAAGLNDATRGDNSIETPGDASEVAVLAQAASRIRAAVDGVAARMNLTPLATVDVYIDDIQFSGQATTEPSQ